MAFKEVAQPKNRPERLKLARKTLKELNLDMDVWIDDQGDTSRALFSDLPHSAIVIDPRGIVHTKLSWCHPAALDLVLDKLKVSFPDEKVNQRDGWFLANIAEKKDPKNANATHHRMMMLSHLVVTQPEHADHNKWLDELSKSGPEHQQEWARNQKASKNK